MNCSRCGIPSKETASNKRGGVPITDTGECIVCVDWREERLRDAQRRYVAYLLSHSRQAEERREKPLSAYT